MPAFINFKICDNSKDCSGIEACPTGAFFWDDEKKTIVVDNAKCTSCGACENSCPVGAIRVAKNDDELAHIKREIDADTRTVSDLFVDRYGAQPVHPAFNISEDKFDVQILESSKPAVVELFSSDSINCLLHSIPIKQLFPDSDIKYRKIEVKESSLPEKYAVSKLPALLFFRNGNLVGKIEGYFVIKMKAELIDEVNKILVTQQAP